MVTSLLSSVLRACARSVRACSALRTAASTSSGSARNSGRSTGVMVARQTGSSVPLTITRFSASSAVAIVASACASACRRVAASASDCTTSSGAMVPTSTRALLSCDQVVGEVERPLRHVHRLPGEHQFPVRVPDVGDGLRQRAAQLDLGDVVVDRGDLQLHPRAVDHEVAQQRLRDRWR